jgi:hypothetical protein
MLTAGLSSIRAPPPPASSSRASPPSASSSRASPPPASSSRASLPPASPPDARPRRRNPPRRAPAIGFHRVCLGRRPGSLSSRRHPPPRSPPTVERVRGPHRGRPTGQRSGADTRMTTRARGRPPRACRREAAGAGWPGRSMRVGEEKQLFFENLRERSRETGEENTCSRAR